MPKNSDLQVLVDKASQLLGDIKPEEDLKAFTTALRQQFWESTLEGEIDEHLGCKKHSRAGKDPGDRRNGKG